MIYYITRNESVSHSPTLYKKLGVNVAIDRLWGLKELNLDLETTGLHYYKHDIVTYAFGNAKDQYIFDAYTISHKELAPLLERKNCTFYIHNAKFDLGFLYHKGIYPHCVVDTMLQERILTCGINNHDRSYVGCVGRYISTEEAEKLNKELRLRLNQDSFHDSEFLEYCALDVKHGIEIAKLQKELLEDSSLTNAADIDNQFVRVLAYVKRSGIKLNIPKWVVKMYDDYEFMTKRKKALNDFLIRWDNPNYLVWSLSNEQETVEPTVNWDSPKQVIVLFEELGIDVKTVDKKTGNIKKSVQAAILNPQRDRFPIVNDYLQYKEGKKKWSAYGNNFIDLAVEHKDHRIRTNFNQIMNTGRMSSSNPINFQNIPRGVERSCFEPDPGNKFIVADYSQQEQVIMANKSRDKQLLEFFKSGGGDMHAFVARCMYPEIIKDTPLKEIKTKFPSLRQDAKAVGFAINYGGSAHTIARNLGISNSEAQKIVDKYFQAFPGVADYMEKQKTLAWDNGFIEIHPISGRKVYFENWQKKRQQVDAINWTEYKFHKERDTEAYNDYWKPSISPLMKYRGMIQRKSLNYPIQGSGADMIKCALIIFFKWVQKEKLIDTVLIPNVVHDEIVIEAPESIARKAKNMLEYSMNKAGKVFCPIHPVKAEANIGDYWDH